MTLGSIRTTVNSVWKAWLMAPGHRAKYVLEEKVPLPDVSSPGSSDLALRAAWVAMYTLRWLDGVAVHDNGELEDVGQDMRRQSGMKCDNSLAGSHEDDDGFTRRRAGKRGRPPAVAGRESDPAAELSASFCAVRNAVQELVACEGRHRAASAASATSTAVLLPGVPPPAVPHTDADDDDNK